MSNKSNSEMISELKSMYAKLRSSQGDKVATEAFNKACITAYILTAGTTSMKDLVNVMADVLVD